LCALRYNHGEGVEVDLDEARRWYARAAAKGHEPSIDALARLDRKAKEAESERIAAELLRDA
jgi:TPR repeat protein